MTPGVERPRTRPPAGDVQKIYNPGPLQGHVLKGVDAVEEGDYVAIMGHSGSGK